MLRLLLLRHAKSSWSEPGIGDAARPLAARGEQAAAAMGRVIATMNPAPVRVLCSPARRAVETLALVSARMPAPPVPEVIASLYDFGDGTVLLTAIRHRGARATPLMLVGHNPSLENLADRLIASGPVELRQRLASKFPAGALAVIDFPVVSWAELAEESGALVQFIRPRDVSGKSGGI